jgi:putative transposase
MWHRLYYPLVWTTRLREPLLDAAAARFVCPYFRSVAARYRARILAVGAVSTHVHVLIAGDPQTDFPKLIGHLKGGSATTWNKVHAEAAGWRMQWAPGYGLSTVGRTQVQSVREYLGRQPEHHPLERIDGWEGDRQDHELLR